LPRTSISNLNPEDNDTKKPRLSKKEERLRKKQEKKERKFNQQKEKLIATSKEAKNKQEPKLNKSPSNKRDPNKFQDMLIEWDCTDPDLEGKWSWGIERNQLITDKDEINEFIKQNHNSTWNEILSQASGGKNRIAKHHHQEVQTIVNEAKKRWYKLFQEYDTAFRFRLGGEKRLWGYRIKNKFYVKWWDPTHKVYPTEKKNT